MKKRLLSGGLIVAFTVMTIYILLSSREIAAFPEMMAFLDMRFIVLAMMALLGYWICGGLLLYFSSKGITEKVTIMRSMYLSFAGCYYSIITPFASGSQPAQVLIMRNRYQMSVPQASSILVKKGIAYHVVIAIYAIVVYASQFNYLKSNFLAILPFVTIGLIINVVLAIGIILLAYSDAVVRKILVTILQVFHRLRLFRKQTVEDWDEHIDEYARCLKAVKQDPIDTTMMLLVTTIQMTLFFGITYLIYLALGQSGTGGFQITAIQALLYLVVSYMPTPGGAGANEGTFYVLFKGIFSNSVLLYAMTFRTIITFYINMIFSGIMLVVIKTYYVIVERRRVS